MYCSLHVLLFIDFGDCKINSTIVVKPVLLAQPLNKDTEVKELEFDESEVHVACKPKRRKRVNTWRLFQPQDRDVLIIGSFGNFGKQSV